MAKFGGWSKFGGGSRYGGRDSWWHSCYRQLKGILVTAGFWSDDDEKLINYILRGEAQLVAHGHIFAERLEAEMFPQGADEALARWERFLNVVPKDGATITERRDAVVARWRGGQGSSLPEIRRALYPLLRPSTAWRDDFADESLSYRWTSSGNGTRTESGSDLTMVATAAVNCELDGVTDNGNMIRRRVHDPNDDFTVTLDVMSVSIGGGGAAGVGIFGDFDNMIAIVFGDSSDIRVDQIIEGTLTEDVGSAADAAPSAPEYLQIEKVAGELVFRYGDDLTALTELHRLSTPRTIKTREVCAYVRNTAPGLNASSMAIDMMQLVHATPHNNVEIIERTAAALDVRGAPYEDLLIAFVHRRPDDPGDYNLAEAQRLADKARQAHTLLLVGESDVFKAGDPYSLCGRDILGPS
ncbi:MAG: DUF2313 domain-containing protein [Myxococcales bacterium]|nr:DUF2313 domain-containing protein [Myxococcales bacterium]